MVHLIEQDNKNYYEVLEIPIDASQQEVHNGYIRAKNAYSGESVALYSLLSENECRGMLDVVEEAYSILSDPAKRTEYNRVRGFDTVFKKFKDGSKTIHYVEESTHLPRFKENQDFTFEAKSTDSSKQNTSNTYPLSNSSEKNQSESHSSVSPQSSPRPDSIFSLASSGLSSSMKSTRPEGLPKNTMADDFNINRKDVQVSRITAYNRNSLNYEVKPEFETTIAETKVFSGELIRQIREYKNMSMDRLSEITKISKMYLTAIEYEEKNKLPAMVYTRGFVYQVAKTLKLNPEIVANSYIQNLKAKT